jgi:hypothetical protein
MKRLFTLIIMAYLSYPAKCQEFIDDATMKLTGISSDKKYGYKPKARHSIKVGSIENEYKFIHALTGPNGEKVYAQRLGSCCMFPTKSGVFGKGLLDIWEITYDGLQKPIIIYLNGYEYDDPKCPKGLGFKRPLLSGT